jgi:ribosomal protein S18 acetylase RimI-like enzyme
MGASLERSEPIRGATWADFQRAVDLLGRQSRLATGITAVREEFVRTDWELPSFEVGRDNWVAGDTGYAAVSPGGRLKLAAPDDAAADALLEHATARARERGLAKLELEAVPGDDVHRRLLQRRPFQLQTDVLTMWRQLTDPEPGAAWPEDVTARTFAPDDARAVQALLDEAYRGWDSAYVPLAHEDWQRSMTGDAEFDPTVWWLAEHGGTLAGCALWWSSGWLKDLVVRESERGRGLGTALVREGLAEFARRGVSRIGLKVDAANPTGAVRLYEGLGFVADRRDEVGARWL